MSQVAADIRRRLRGQLPFTKPAPKPRMSRAAMVRCLMEHLEEANGDELIRRATRVFRGFGVELPGVLPPRDLKGEINLLEQQVREQRRLNETLTAQFGRRLYATPRPKSAAGIRNFLHGNR